MEQQQPDSKQQDAEEQQQPEQQEQQQDAEQPEPQTIQQLGNCKLLHSSKDMRIWECADFCGRPCLIKQTSAATAAAKHPLLDRKVTKQPCQQDVAGMCRARKVGVPTPTPYHVSSQHSLVFCERVDGGTLQQRLAEAQGEGAAGADELLTELGRVLAVLHNGGVVHGGLSCSCVLVRATDQALVLRDFEHFANSTMPRDKASDLVLLEADLQQAAPHLPGAFDKVVASYNKHNKQWSAVFNRLPEARNALQKHQRGQPAKRQKTS